MYEGKLLSTLKKMSTFSSHINDRSYYEFNQCDPSFMREKRVSIYYTSETLNNHLIREPEYKYEKRSYKNPLESGVIGGNIK